MNIFTLDSTANQKEAGVYPQIEIDFKKTIAKGSRDYKLINDFNFPDKNPDLDSFEFARGAKITDILSSNKLGTDFGIFCNNKVKDILIQYNLNICKFYQLELMSKIESLEYQFCHLISDESLIDFDSSFFCDIDNKAKRLQIASYDEIEDISFEKGIVISPKTIVLKKRFDFFRLPMDINIYISEKLKTTLEENKITGMEIEPAKIKFECQTDGEAITKATK